MSEWLHAALGWFFFAEFTIWPVSMVGLFMSGWLLRGVRTGRVGARDCE